MKKIVTGLFAAAMVASFAISAFAAAPLFTEDYSYTLGSAIAGQGGWVITGTVLTNPQLVNSAGLTYVGYPGSGVGNALGPLATSGEDDNHTFTGVTAGAAYAAFMVNVASAQTTGDYFLHFFDGAVSGNLFRGRVFVKKDASSANYAFGVQSSSAAGSLVYTPFSFATGSTHLIVLKYAFVAGTTNDIVSLFVDPVVGCTEPTATLSTVTTTSEIDATSIDAIGTRQGTGTNAASVVVDGIRVAGNWGDAVCGGTTPTHSSTWGQVKSIYR